tara:strand:+ start:434 stop:598 length:165 start_codon:yes stop_codon:yes gene_type:complete
MLALVIESEFVCFDRLSTLNVVVSDLTDSQVLLLSAGFGFQGLAFDPDAWSAYG